MIQARLLAASAAVTPDASMPAIEAIATTAASAVFFIVLSYEFWKLRFVFLGTSNLKRARPWKGEIMLAYTTKGIPLIFENLDECDGNVMICCLRQQMRVWASLEVSPPTVWLFER
jgi:hypothetical protein